MKVSGYEFPEKCPENCKGKDEPLYQGCLCHRCPVLNCSSDDPLVHPDEYRKDWAKQFYEFIVNNGDSPYLRF